MHFLGREFHIESARGKIAYLYGKDVARKIFRDSSQIRITLSSTGRVRHVYLQDKLLFTLRLDDGYLLPTLEGAKYIPHAVVIQDDAVPFVRKGKSVMAKSIITAHPDLRPGMEVAVRTREGEVVAVGRLLLALDEITSVRRGVAVKTRDYIERYGEATELVEEKSA